MWWELHTKFLNSNNTIRFPKYLGLIMMVFWQCLHLQLCIYPIILRVFSMRTSKCFLPGVQQCQYFIPHFHICLLIPIIFMFKIRKLVRTINRYWLNEWMNWLNHTLFLAIFAISCRISRSTTWKWTKSPQFFIIVSNNWSKFQFFFWKSTIIHQSKHGKNSDNNHNIYRQGKELNCWFFVLDAFLDSFNYIFSHIFSLPDHVFKTRINSPILVLIIKINK